MDLEELHLKKEGYAVMFFSLSRSDVDLAPALIELYLGYLSKHLYTDYGRKKAFAVTELNRLHYVDTHTSNKPHTNTLICVHTVIFPSLQENTL